MLTNMAESLRTGRAAASESFGAQQDCFLLKKRSRIVLGHERQDAGGRVYVLWTVDGSSLLRRVQQMLHQTGIWGGWRLGQHLVFYELFLSLPCMGGAGSATNFKWVVRKVSKNISMNGKLEKTDRLGFSF